ncbi:MAG: hypothetical protein ACWGSQ_19725 [Longimicrobiales bacterium]
MTGGRNTGAAVLLVSVFVAGALGGAVGVKLVDRRDWRPPDEHGFPMDRMGGRTPPMGGRDRGPDRFGIAPMWLADRLADQLSLTDEQRGQITSILESRQARASEALSEIGPFLKSQLDSTNLEIRAVLRPEQQERFDEFVSREDERLFRRGGFPRPGAPPGGFH